MTAEMAVCAPRLARFHFYGPQKRSKNDYRSPRFAPQEPLGRVLGGPTKETRPESIVPRAKKRRQKGS